MALFLILAATFLIPQHAVSQTCTADTLQFQTLLQHNFNRLSGEAGSIRPLYDMVRRYLDAVQPNDFPTEIIQESLKDPNFLTQNYQEALRYEAGYLVSFIIGVLFFLIMPLVGLLFCCCRCCNNCGGRVKERTETTDCQRHTLAIFLLMTTIVILAGVACAFTANQKVTDAMEPSVTGINATISQAISYINSAVQAVPKIVAQFSVPKKKIFDDLDNIGGTLVKRIKAAVHPIVRSVLEMVSEKTQELSIAKNNLNLTTINDTQSSVLKEQLRLASELKRLQLEISTTLNSPLCQDCALAVSKVNDLELDVNFSEPNDFRVALNKLMSFSPATLNNSVEQGNQLLNEISERVTSETTQIITDIKKTIEDIEADLSTSIEKVQFLDSLQSLSKTLNSEKVVKVSNEVKQYDYYRWIVGIVLCCIILLIIACNVLGLGLGSAGIAMRDDPYSATGCSKSGANFLMAGVGFSFIFSWLLILLVFVTFIVGGNVRTFLCKPWESGEIYKIVDTLGAQDEKFSLSNYFNVSISVSKLHSECEAGKSLWNILPLSQTLDLNARLNLSTYSGDIVQISERLNLNISGVVLLDDTGRTALANNGIDKLNYTSFFEQLNKPLLNPNLTVLANVLEDLGKIQLPPNSTIGKNLTRQAKELRDVENTQVKQLQENLTQLKTSLQYLESFSRLVQNLVNDTIQSIDTAEREITTAIQGTVKNVSECLTRKELGYVEQYLQWVRRTIIDDLLSCQPALIFIDNARIIICDYITDPWNAFWFCLGWCTLFLIPSIIFAVKTAKHYRAIKSKASSPELSEMMHFKFPRVQNTYGPLKTPPAGPAGFAR